MLSSNFKPWKELLQQRAQLILSRRSAVPSNWRQCRFLPPSPLSVYSFSCFTYALLGLWSLFWFRTRPLFPGLQFEATLLILQSVTSFGCDVYSFGETSIWKPIDRGYLMMMAFSVKMIYNLMTYPIIGWRLRLFYGRFSRLSRDRIHTPCIEIKLNQS